MTDATHLAVCASPSLESGGGLATNPTDLQAIIENLRKENARLRLASGGVEETKASMPEETGSMLAESFMLPPRVQKPFSIHDWTGQRRERNIEVGSRVPIEHPTTQIVEQAGSDNAAETGNAGLLVPSTEVAIFLNGNLAVKKLLSTALQHMEDGTGETAATTAFNQAFNLHLQNTDCPYLGFSASVHQLLVQNGGALQTPVQGTSSVLAADTGASSSEKRLALSATLIRQLIDKSAFGPQPPDRRPAGMNRVEYVRELCAQAGLSLDLIRLAMMHKQERLASKTARSQAGDSPASQHKLRSGGKESSNPRTPSRSRSRGCRGKAPVSAREAQLALKRAEKYLVEVQMDLERIHDEAEERAEEARRSRTEEPGNSVVDAECEPQGLETSSLGATNLESNIQAEQASEEVEKSGPENPESAKLCAPELLVTPTWGQFINQQLLPLYIVDLPFSWLKHLLDKTCGVPMDSDDEEQAWRTLGLPMPENPKHTKQSVKKTKKRKHVETDIPAKQENAGAIVVSGPRPVATPSQTGGALLQVPTIVCPKPLRAQMSTSVVENRWKERAETRPMMELRGLGHKSTPAVAASGKTKRRTSSLLVSSALLLSPAPSRSDLPAGMSPVSVRGLRRRPGSQDSSPVHAPRWNLLDTPRRSYEE